jgi:hypothetical protein
MTYPMPPELLEQPGLEARADTDPRWPEEHDALGLRPERWRGQKADEAAGRDRLAEKALNHGG